MGLHIVLFGLLLSLFLQTVHCKPIDYIEANQPYSISMGGQDDPINPSTFTQDTGDVGTTTTTGDQPIPPFMEPGYEIAAAKLAGACNRQQRCMICQVTTKCQSATKENNLSGYDWVCTQDQAHLCVNWTPPGKFLGVISTGSPEYSARPNVGNNAIDRALQTNIRAYCEKGPNGHCVICAESAPQEKCKAAAPNSDGNQICAWDNSGCVRPSLPSS